MTTPERAKEIYIEVLQEQKAPINPDKIIEWVESNWWWISMIGEEVFRWIIKKINQWKQRKKK